MFDNKYDFWYRIQSLSLRCVAGRTTRLVLIATTSKSTSWTLVELDIWKRLKHRCTRRTSGRRITSSSLRVQLPVCTPFSWRSTIEPTTQPELVNSSSTTEIRKWQVSYVAFENWTLRRPQAGSGRIIQHETAHHLEAEYCKKSKHPSVSRGRWKCRTGKCRTWKWRTKSQGMKMQDLKIRDQIAGHENAGPENAGPSRNAASLCS